MISHRKIARGICAIEALRKLDALSETSTKNKEINKNKNKENHKRKHRFWVNPFLMKRSDYDMDCTLLKDVTFEDGREYYNFCKMDIHKFEYIFSQVEDKIKKSETAMRFPVSARTRLAITLRFIATGDSYRSLEFVGQVSRKTISTIVPDVLRAIIESLQDENLKMPASENEWEAIADDFASCWQFPHTLGILEGIHLRIKSPIQSGVDCFSNNRIHSIVLLALVDAYSRFMHIEIISNGAISDKMVYNNSAFYNDLQEGALNLPEDRTLIGDMTKIPFYFIGDEIFGLDRHMLTNYKTTDDLNASQEKFNERLHRTLMASKIAIGKLVERFRVFHRPIEVSNETTVKIVKACCILHNFLLETFDNTARDMHILPETITPLPMQIISSNNTKYAEEMRENVCRYLANNEDNLMQWTTIKTEEVLL